MHHGELVVSTRKLNAIHSLDPATGVLQCQAGCILQHLQEYAAADENNLMVPIDLGSRGSCCIGGNVATNAGGQYFYRYGSVAANLLGLQVVTGDGRILNLNYGECNLKDNTGYKLHQLFVGSEGTLGIITGVALLCRPALHSRHAAFLACDSFDDVLLTLQTAKQRLCETLAVAEWMDGAILDLVGKTFDHAIPLLNADANSCCYPHYLLVETHGSVQEHDRAKMESFLEAVFNDSTVANGVLAQDVHQSQHFWKLRESANPAAAATGYTYKYDVSLPGSNFVPLITEMQERLAERTIVQTNWGHVLDGNLHFNVTDPGNFQCDETILAAIEPFIFEAVIRRGGSISAEHGLGQAKNVHMNKIHDPATIATMRAIKKVFDPAGILNPGKVFPPSPLSPK